jgi:hypothetical protein
MKVTRFKGLIFTKPQEVTSLEEVLSQIRSDKWKDRIAKCRTDLKQKDWLPCFTPTGVFTHRSLAGLQEYNGIICLDIDHIENPEILKSRASELSYVHAVFITPSGKGLKVIVRTDANQESYKETEEMVAQKFLEDTGAARDNRCKDIARIQFVSHDPSLYYNPYSEILKAPLLEKNAENF